jgi:hypothetical protein
LALTMVLAAKTIERIKVEVFMVDGGRKSVVVGRIVRVMQMLRFSKRLVEIMSINWLAVAWSPRSVILPIRIREDGTVDSTGKIG